MFSNLLHNYRWDEISGNIYSRTTRDVEYALHRKGKRSLSDFQALVSPAASPFLEEMAALSHQITRKRFGKTIQLYIPVYLSNECHNVCTYCGFSFGNGIQRKTLGREDVQKEIDAVKAMGYDHVLLVTGEASRSAGMDYFREMLPLFREQFSHISMEVQPLGEEDYRELSGMGVNTVLVYQETYHRENYREHHPRGKKSDFDWRLGTPDRLGSAGIHRIGLGILLGLEDWRTDSFFCAAHLSYLEKKYWRTKYSVSFPRLRPAPGVVSPRVTVSDRDLLQLICAYRIFDEEADLSLSTRESPLFRDHACRLGITAMSAASKTNPGGYASGAPSLEQFDVHDERTAGEIADMIRAHGYEPVWKDWDKIL